MSSTIAQPTTGQTIHGGPIGAAVLAATVALAAIGLAASGGPSRPRRSPGPFRATSRPPPSRTVPASASRSCPARLGTATPISPTDAPST